MLAPTPYLTAADLGLTEKENWALAEVQRRLENGELKHVKTSGVIDLHDETICAFNMKYSHCGTVACLGGWMAILLGYNVTALGWYVSNQQRLHDLFYPLEREEPSNHWEKITSEQAVAAIKHFRMTGDANEAWELAL